MILQGYEKTFETKILRIKHRIAFKPGTRKIDLIDMLRHIPDEAIVDEVIDDADDTDMATIEFHEEKCEC